MVKLSELKKTIDESLEKPVLPNDESIEKVKNLELILNIVKEHKQVFNT